MHLGDLEVRYIYGGGFRLDGGAMFGVVPKTMWEKKCAPDEKNRVKLSGNALLVRAGRKNILIETGCGTIWEPKLREIYQVQDGNPLGESLRKAGVEERDIDVVINTHLHFDHAGGNTRLADGKAVPAFPNAEYVVQRGELEHAMNPTERDRASYFADRFVPVQEAGQWRLVDGDAEVLPGISLVRIPGHNADIQAVKISGGGKTIFFCADLSPTRHHVPLAWIMAYDLYPLTTLETKRKWIGEIARQGWIVVFGHDAEMPAAMLQDRDGKVQAGPVELNK